MSGKPNLSSGVGKTDFLAGLGIDGGELTELCAGPDDEAAWWAG